MKYFILLFIFAANFIYCQQRILVNPNMEVIPLKKGESAQKVLDENIQNSMSNGCSQFIFGVMPSPYEPNGQLVAFGANNMDMLAMWFVARADGIIDTLYWKINQIGSPDAQIIIRIFRSNIYSGHGPAYPPYPPPCINWGYYNLINGTDSLITPYAYEATDTNWISTAQNGTTTFDPLGEDLWIENGLPYTPHIGINKIGLSQYGYQLVVKEGDVFFITMRAVCANNTDTCFRTEAWGSGGHVNTTDEYYPSRIWKFYMKDSQASNCAGHPLNSVSKGWVARGPFQDDTLFTSLFEWWYLLTITNPPLLAFSSDDGGINGPTFSKCDHKINLSVSTCESNPESVDAKIIAKWYKAKTKAGILDFVQQPDIQIPKPDAGYIWTASFPCLDSGTTVKYSLVATNNGGYDGTWEEHTFKVITLANRYYWVDTSNTYVQKSISNSGTEINPFEFFVPPGSLAAATEHGTAGPFDIGGPFVFFGDTVRYAWIGVHGAIALSKQPDDIIDVNANGYYNSGWDLPSLQHHSRSDFANNNKIPPNFIAPLWSNLALANYHYDPNIYGHIRYGNNGDSCLFIVEWDSLGYGEGGWFEPSRIVFRVVLNRCDGTIEYQYDNLDDYQDWMNILVGMQADSNKLSGSEPGNILIYKNVSKSGGGGYMIGPVETLPRNNHNITFYPGPPIAVDEGWQLLSLSHRPDIDTSLTSLYPNAISDAFIYNGQYEQTRHIEYGKGYWIKFAPGYAGVAGHEIKDLAIPVNTGWNIIGTISKPVPVENVIPNPSGLAFGDFFRYDPGIGYQRADTLEPGRGYWVKVNQSGSLILSSTPPPQTFAHIRIVPTSELPPPPPSEDKQVREIPKEFSLSDAYPNPFNPSTIINYQLPIDNWVTLKVYNLLGQEIATLVDAFQEAGYKSVEWDAHKFASGIFFYKFSTERFVQIKKMILIR